jgi:hypothetical protein
MPEADMHSTYSRDVHLEGSPDLLQYQQRHGLAQATPAPAPAPPTPKAYMYSGDVHLDGHGIEYSGPSQIPLLVCLSLNT